MNENLENPSDFCNWVYKNEEGGGLIIGGYPFITEDFRKNHIDKLLDLNIDHYVSLCENEEIEKYGDYKEYILNKKPNTQFISFPIKDWGIVDDNKTFNLILDIYNLVKTNKLVYVHCLGGHGRSGVIACGFLIMNNQINHSKEEPISPINRSNEAIKINNLKHLTRKYKPEIRSPQTAKQIRQVIRFGEYWFGKKVDLLMN